MARPGETRDRHPAMTEKPYFLQQGGERVFVMLHRPEGPCHGGAVLCAPLAEEKLWSHRVFVSLARELARAGYAVFRFDYRGEGDSDRNFEDSCLDTRIEDTARAIDELRRQVAGNPDVTLIGLRLGASIAALAAAGRKDVSRLVLWDPVTDGADYMQSVLRSNLMYQMALHRKVVEDRETLLRRIDQGELVNVEGYELGGPLFRQVSAIRLAELGLRPAVRSLIVSIAAQESPPRQDLVALGARWNDATIATAVEQPFWREIRKFYNRAGNLFRVTTDWLDVKA
ncbi:MAG: alpha/beta fold hydrolase [Steroidobacteraceae bacterium]